MDTTIATLTALPLLLSSAAFASEISLSHLAGVRSLSLEDTADADFSGIGNRTALFTSKLRRLRDNPFDLFQPLSCNDPLPDTCTDSFLDLLKANDDPVVVPCGRCVRMDATGSIDLMNGLDIQGKLQFPPNYKITITTPFVFVQGVLEITDTNAVVPANEGVKFILTGTNDWYFNPHEENAMGCPDRSCPVGKKPFIVAGGRMDIRGLGGGAKDCPPWAKIEDIFYAQVVPDDYPTPPTMADGCVRILSKEDFEDVAPQYPVTWRGGLGGIDQILTESDVSNSFLRVSNRNLESQGPTLDLGIARMCLVPDVYYVFSARFRLSRLDGVQTECSATGQNCLKLESRHRDYRDYNYSREKSRMRKEEGKATVDGEWFTFVARFMFSQEETAPGNVFEVLAITGPEEGAVIDMDDIYIGLPPEEIYPDASDPGSICEDLFPADGSADGYTSPPMYPYPLYSNRAYNSALQVISEIDEEGSINNFYRLKGRWEEYESLGFNLIPDCVRVGSQYTIKMRVRVNHDDTFKKAFVEIRYHSPINDKWDHWRSSQLPTLGGKRWVDVEVGFLINDNLGASDELQFRLANTGYADGKGDQAADIDYDDISISLAHGPVRGLVVPESALTCWGEGSDVLITSHTSEWDNEQLAVVAAGSAPLNNGSGMAVLRLEGIGGKAIRRPLTVKDTARTATEVALLSRNIKLTTDDEGVVGGYMQIYGTTGVAQTLEGVEISNFGQKDIKNRYPVQFNMCADVAGSKISKNVVRQSNYGCFVITGTHKVEISRNVAYDSIGHCFAITEGKEEDNIITGNLAALTRDDGSYSTSSFLIRNPNNDVIKNVAAGSQRNGVRLDLDWEIRGDAQNLPGENYNPQYKELGKFSDNVVHSNRIGFVVVNYRPKSEEVFQNIVAYRNADRGVLLHQRNLAIENAYISDNRVVNLDFENCDSCRISDSEIIGYSKVYRDQVMKQEIFHDCQNNPQLDHRLIGIETMHYSHKDYWSPGSNLTNVQFSGFDDTGCFSPRRHLIFQNIRHLPHFDWFPQIKGLSNADGGNFRFDLCSSANIGVEDVLFTDLDSSMHPNGPGSFSGISSLVSNRAWMKGFARGQCIDVPEMCYSYCEDTCLRFVSFYVDKYDTEDVLLVVTDTESQNKIEVGGNFDYSKKKDENRQYTLTDVYSNTKVSDYRVFSVPLPVGTYEAKFMKDKKEFWPTFVEEPVFEPDPGCGGVQKGSVNVLVPPIESELCRELVKNGDGNIQGGNYTHWSHVGGGVLNEALVGIQDSTALVSTSRSSVHHGFGFHIDTRCLKEMVGQEYELVAQVHLELNGAPLECDPDNYDYTKGCPGFHVQTRTWDEAQKKFLKHDWMNLARVVRPYNANGYNLIHGTFVISKGMANADSTFFWIARTSKHAKPETQSAVDGALVSTITSSVGCSEDLVINGDFEEISSNTQFWNIRDYDGKLSIIQGGADGSAHAIQVTGRTSSQYQGPLQWLNPSCLIEGQEYEVTIRFKLSQGENYIACDMTLYPGSAINACPEARIYAWTEEVLPGETRTSNAFKIAPVVSPGSDTKWGTIFGVFTANAMMANAYKAFLYVGKAGEGVDIAIDDVHVNTYAKDCSNLVLNGDFEVGDARSWTFDGSPISVHTEGANGSTFSIIQEERERRDWGMKQGLDISCIVLGEVYVMTAKIKLLKDKVPFECNPNVVLGTEGCPTAQLFVQSSERKYRDIAAVVGNLDNGWYPMRGTFEFFPYDKASSLVELKIKDAPAFVDLIIDEVAIVTQRDAA